MGGTIAASIAHRPQTFRILQQTNLPVFKATVLPIIQGRALSLLACTSSNPQYGTFQLLSFPSLPSLNRFDSNTTKSAAFRSSASGFSSATNSSTTIIPLAQLSSPTSNSTRPFSNRAAQSHCPSFIRDVASAAPTRTGGCTLPGQRPRISAYGGGTSLISFASRFRFTSSLIGSCSMSPKSYATYCFDPARLPPEENELGQMAELNSHSPGFWKVMQRDQTPQLYDHLLSFSRRGYVKAVETLVRILLVNRKEKINQRLYRALILVNINPTAGSVGSVRSLLEEMADERIEPDAETCYAILKVLAVHTDHLLRAEILSYMSDRWFELTQGAYHDVIAGLIREGQLAMALEKLDQMLETARFPMESWLHSLLMHALLNAGEVDEALEQVRYAEKTAATATEAARPNSFRAISSQMSRGVISISTTLWYRFLDVASAAYHYEATKYTWRQKVVTSAINPPTGICLKVLETAGRAGDAALATDVLRVLGNRRHRFTTLHYEPVIEAYIGSGDLQKAMAVLSVMYQAGIEPTSDTTRSIFTYLCSEPELPATAFSHLLALSESSVTSLGSKGASGGKKNRKYGADEPVDSGAATIVPIAAVNVVLEATVQKGDIKQALDQYTRLRDVCHTGPTVETFNILFRGCRLSYRQDIAMFLVSEMVALGLRPDHLTYDRLTLIMTETAGQRKGVRNESERDLNLWTDHSLAIEYIELMVQNGCVPRRGTLRKVFIELVKSALELRDRGRAGIEGSSSSSLSSPVSSSSTASASSPSLSFPTNLPSSHSMLATRSSAAATSTTLITPESNLARFWSAIMSLVSSQGVATELARLCESTPNQLKHLIPQSIVRHTEAVKRNNQKSLLFDLSSYVSSSWSLSSAPEWVTRSDVHDRLQSAAEKNEGKEKKDERVVSSLGDDAANAIEEDCGNSIPDSSSGSGSSLSSNPSHCFTSPQTVDGDEAKT